MSGQEENYDGYVNTNTVRQEAGFSNEVRVSDKRINQAIKTAEEYINDEINTVFLPYSGATSAPPQLIKQATLLMAIAVVRAPFPDELNTYDKNWKLGLELLKRFKETNPTAQTGVSGTSFLSDYNADTNNPNATPDLTSKTFNTDYVPTFRS